MKKFFLKLVSISILFLCSLGCTEPFSIIETIDQDYDNLLVVESTLTNEVKYQEIKLTRSAGLNEYETLIENDAQVSIEDGNGNIFKFSQEPNSGVYLSNIQFGAINEVSYTLKIKTQNGKEYSSSKTFLTTPVEIDTVYPEIDEFDDFKGVTIYVDSHDDSNAAKYFRFEYEETYEIKVPYPSNYDWEFTRFGIEDEGFYEVILSWKPPKTTCYSPTFKSKGIMQFSTTTLDESNVVHFPIHFIWEESPMLRERYSILVKQYIQSAEAYTYFKTISELGKTESLLSQSQTGYVTGNMSSLSNPDEKVLGFFEASAVSTKRIYFNYFDLGYEFPPYFYECEKIHMLPTKELKDKIENENYQIVDWTEDGPIKGYFIYKENCTDCTSFASETKPDFWEE